jgi:hypothetical protein
MKKLYPIIIVGLSIWCFSGCTFINGLDAKIPRSVIPIEKTFVVELQYRDRDVIRKEILLERYYDAMASVRGNYWTVREVGSTSQYQTSKIIIHDNEIGTIEIPVPSSDDLVKSRRIPLSFIFLKINGETFGLISSEGSNHTYSRVTLIDKSSEELVTLNFTLKVNGVTLE